MYAHPQYAAGSTLAPLRLTMPSTSVSRVIRAPQQDIWALLSDIEHANKWNRAWTGIRFTSGQTHGSGTTFRAAMGDGDDSFDFEVCEWSAPERIAFCPIRHPGEMYSITLESHKFEVRALTDGESEVTITAKARAHGIRGRIMAMFFWSGHQEEGLNTALDSIQTIFEPDFIPESATSEHEHTTTTTIEE
jgi:uncharacterized protein YndB with AHSA1/START domain